MMGYEDILKWSGALGVATVMVVTAPAKADPRAVVELFTSQGCSSCPPADKILGELAKDPSIVALSMPIDYWDYLGWKDTLADSRFSARQKAYSHVRGDRDVYTPQVIVNGETHVIGSDRAGIENAIHATRKSGDVMSVPISTSTVSAVRRPMPGIVTSRSISSSTPRRRSATSASSDSMSASRSARW